VGCPPTVRHAGALLVSDTLAIHELMLRLLFLALLCSLVVPRAAWGAHLAGHGDLSVAAAVHTHHADHAHEHDGKNPAEHDDALGGEDGDDGLTHEHSPAFAVGSGEVPPELITLSDWPLSAEDQVERETAGEHLRHPDSLLRPPRTA
jgi:hypothetical protein